MINPIPDFYRVQLDFSTHHYCYSEEYYFSKNKIFSIMSDEELRRQDVELGYLKSYDDLYTDELLKNYLQN